MASVTNKTLNTGTVTANRELMSETSGLLVNDATFLVEDALGPVGTPWTISNKALNTGSVTNKTYQDP